MRAAHGLVVGLAFVVAGPVSAQAARPAGPAERARAAIALPAAARELRAAGVPSREVARALDALATRSVPADEARSAILAATEATAARGPIDNLGAFVAAQLDAGVRGRALAAAIRAAPSARPGAGQAQRDTATQKRGDRAGGAKQRIP